MIDSDRIDEVLRAIGEYWKRHQDLKLGRVLDHIHYASVTSRNQWSMTDEDIMAGVARLIRDEDR